VQLPMTPIRLLRRTAPMYADKPAVICGGTSTSYRQFHGRVNALSHALLDMGVNRGDRVAYLALNCHRLVEGYFGVPQIGAVLVCLNIRLHPDELAFILNDAQPRVLILSSALVPLWLSLRDRCGSVERVILMDGPSSELDAPVYDDLLARMPRAAPPDPPIDEKDLASLFYTSGTTSRPKGVMLSYRNIYAHAVSAIISLDYRDVTRQLVGTVPLFHVNAWGSPHNLVGVGGTQVVVARFDPEIVCEAVQATGANRLLLVPTMLNALLNFPRLTEYDLSTLDRIVLGGAATPRALIEHARAVLHCECLVGYGLTETSPIVSVATIKDTLQHESSEEKDRRQATTGLPSFGLEAEIFDDNDALLPHDGTSRGEIRVRGDSVMIGYWNRPEETDAVFKNGWFCTGDIATIDAEGYLNIVDRKKDIIISGGENIAPTDIEDALFRHPAVLEAAVIGVPDTRWGEVPRAVVVLRPGHEASEDEILGYCREHLAGFKVPKAVDFVSELPKTGTGKVQKQVLREPFWQGHESRVV
jgi:fatty-acyl-CoA synthase